MASAICDKVLVVIQLSGGNDCLNTVVPYTNDLYYDFRPTIHIASEDVLPINDAFGFNPSMEPIKRLWDEGKVRPRHGGGFNRLHLDNGRTLKLSRATAVCLAIDIKSPTL